MTRLHPTRLTAAFVGFVLIVFGTFGTLTPAQAIGTVHAPIVGSGSTWSANALQQWIRNVWANYQWKLTYSESGSTQGRNDFKNGTADFGVSEIPYAISNSNEGDSRPNRGFAYMPIVAGGTAFMYNLEINGRKVTNLRLSGETLSRVFTNQIKTWNDPAIQADNPQLALPATPIVPVVRSDGSGTSAQFTLWMRQTHPDIWNAYCDQVNRPRAADGVCGVTSNYPTIVGSGFVARSGANGVAGYVAQAHAVGSITFVEYSYALNAKFPVVKLLNSAGYYTEPTASNVAVALLSARINEDTNSPDYLTQELSQVYTSADSRVYPLSSYSYIILPTTAESNFTEDKGLTLADFGSYFLCEGQQQAESLGYSPLPINLVQAGQAQIAKVPGGNPTIKTIAQCNNPTFDPNGGNRLANTAPFPEDCDKQGPVQCARGTGGAKDVPTDTGGTGNAGTGGNAAGTNAGSGAAAGVAGAADAPAAAIASDASAGTAESDAAVVAAGTPQNIPAAGIGGLGFLAAIGGGGVLLASAVVPPWLGRRRHRPAALIPHTDSGASR